LRDRVLGSCRDDAPHADAAADVPVDRLTNFFTNFVPTATLPPEPSEAGMPERFDGVIAP
jgi:hypothetical protein